MPLPFPPRNPLIQPFTLHHKVGHETQRDVMLLGARRLDRSGSAPLVAHLTGSDAVRTHNARTMPIALARTITTSFLPVRLRLDRIPSARPTCVVSPCRPPNNLLSDKYVAISNIA